MKTKTLLSLLIFFLIGTSCKQQNKKENSSLLSDNKKDVLPVAAKDTLNKPKIKIKANKQYDDKGNLIRYDSTYSYSYSTPEGKSIQSNNDSIYKQFRSFFDKNYSDLFKDQYNDVFLNDSLFKYDFFNNDYFTKRFELNKQLFDKAFKQMDSIKSNYLQKKYPNAMQKKNKSKT